jgi:serine/threonine protein kinase
MLQRFELREQIGDGGMGTVYRAHDPQLDRDVAIKVLKASAAEARDELATHRTLDLRAPGVERGSLLEEARMMARLSHPNVVPIYEVGLDGDELFVVMEYVAGRDLRGWLDMRPPAAEIRAVFAQAARGLAAAHERGIVHRDFKPDNVLIGGDGRARVTDFGLARLAEPPALVRTTSVAGTPKYMAPELWRGVAATTAADVYAFAASLREALGGDLGRIDEPLRSRLEAALREEPAARGPITALIEALEIAAPPKRRPVVAIAGAAAVVIAGAGIAIGVATASEDSPACTLDAAALAGHWDAAARERVRGSLGDATVAAIDRRAHEILELRRATCEAGKRGELAGAQLAQRTACLDRRAIELGVIVEAQIADKLSPAHAESLLNRMPLATSCNELAMPPPAGDARALAPLYLRLARTYTREAAAVVDELAAIEAAARAAGDLEFAARAGIAHGGRLRQLDRAKQADAVLQAAYRDALALHADDVAALALVERFFTVGNAVDVSSANMLVTLARDLAAKPTVSPRTRLRVHHVAGRDQLVRGEYAKALATLREALAEAAASGQRNADIVLITQMDLVDAMVLHGGKSRGDAIAVGERTLELAREVNGERSHNYGYSLLLLAKAYMLLNKHADALAYRRKALAVQRALYPADHSRVIETRGDLGISLAQVGELEAAERELAETVALAQKNQTMQRLYGFLLGNYGRVVAARGRHAAAIEHYERALQHMAMTHGPDHRQTLGQRFRYAEILLETGRLDDVERQIKLLEEAYRRSPLPTDLRSAETRGTLAAAIALARGRPADAEAIARRALDELTELGASAEDQRVVQLRVGEALIAQRKYAAARPVVEAALAASREVVSRPDDLGRFEVALARIELELGDRASAVARANDLRDRIEPFTGALRIRAELAKLPAK